MTIGKEKVGPQIVNCQLSIVLSCCVERITFGNLFESKYAGLVQFHIHFFAIRKVHDHFIVTSELQQLGRFTVSFYVPALICFIENQIDSFSLRKTAAMSAVNSGAAATITPTSEAEI